MRTLLRLGVVILHFYRKTLNTFIIQYKRNVTKDLEHDQKARITCLKRF